MTLFVYDLMHDLIALRAVAHHLEVAAPARQARHTRHRVPAPVAQRLLLRGGHSLVMPVVNVEGRGELDPLYTGLRALKVLVERRGEKEPSVC